MHGAIALAEDILRLKLGQCAPAAEKWLLFESANELAWQSYVCSSWLAVMWSSSTCVLLLMLLLLLQRFAGFS